MRGILPTQKFLHLVPHYVVMVLIWPGKDRVPVIYRIRIVTPLGAGNRKINGKRRLDDFIEIPHPSTLRGSKGCNAVAKEQDFLSHIGRLLSGEGFHLFLQAASILLQP